MSFIILTPERDFEMYTVQFWTKWFVPLTQYRAGDKIKKNEMGWVCGAYGWGEGSV